ncbi:RNA polymerase sigma factor [Planctomycetota bacterium]
MDADTLSDMVNSAKKGGKDNFAPLVDLFWRPAYGLAYQYLGRSQDSEDVVQESFYKAFKHLPSLRKGAKFPAWLFEIIRRECARQSNRSRGMETLPAGMDEAVATKPREDSGDNAVENLRGAINRLPQDLQELIAMHYHGGWKIEDIAAARDKPEHKIWNDLRKARQLLKTMLQATN